VVRAAIYCRISPTKENKEEKLERQEADSRAVCDRNGWLVEGVFIDPSRSAWMRNRKRPGWDQMLEGVRDGEFDAIVIYHGDRLIRQPWDLELLLSLASEKGIRLASPTGARNLDNADDRFILRIEAAQACKASDDTSRRVKRAKSSLREQGIATLGRTRAFGRELDGSIIEAEAELIRDVFERIIAGEPVASLWHEWSFDGVPAVKAAQWRYGSFRQMLQRPDLAGLVAYQGKPVGEATNLRAIVGREQWDAVQTILGNTAAKYDRQPRPRKHLLSGIAVCSGCDQTVNANATVSGVMRYRCIWPACPRPTSRNMTLLDEYVIGNVLRRLADDRVWERIAANRAAAADDGGRARADLEALRARREQVAEEFADDDEMDPALLRKMLARLDERIGQAQARLGGNRASSVLDGLQNLDRPGWDGLALGRRRSVVRELVTVKLFPSAKGPSFDVKSVEVLDA